MSSTESKLVLLTEVLLLSSTALELLLGRFNGRGVYDLQNSCVLIIEEK